MDHAVIWLENLSGRTIKVIIRDGGKEYSPAAEKAFAREKGIHIRESAPRTPEQNGKAEVVGRHIVEMARSARINAGLPEFLWPQAIKHTIDVRNLTPKRQLDWKSPHELLGRALNLPDRSIQPYTKHLRIFGCEAYVRIPEEDPEFVKARKIKARSRLGAFVGTEGLRGHVFVIWIPEKQRLYHSRDVQFREEIQELLDEKLAEIIEPEEEKTYRITIPNEKVEESEEAQEQQQNPTGEEAEASTMPAGYRYGTLDSIPESAVPVVKIGDGMWYPDNISPYEEEEVEKPEEKEERQVTKEPKKGSRLAKEVDTGNVIQTSSRSGRNKRSDVSKHQFISYVAFVAAQIVYQYIPTSFREAMSGPDRDFWLAACETQLEKIKKKGTWELCDLPKGYKAIPTKWVFDPKLKARLIVCRDFEKKADVETFVAVVNMTMVKIFFLIVAILGWECMQYDFVTAFLNGNLIDRLVFVRQPPGFGDGTKRVLRLFKTL